MFFFKVIKNTSAKSILRDQVENERWMGEGTLKMSKCKVSTVDLCFREYGAEQSDILEAIQELSTLCAKGDLQEADAGPANRKRHTIC